MVASGPVRTVMLPPNRLSRCQRRMGVCCSVRRRRVEGNRLASVSSARAGIVAHSTLGAAVTLDRARIRWRQGVRTGLVVALIVGAGLTWSTTDVVVAMALGAAFVGIADTTDPDRNRLAGLCLTLLALMLATGVGGLIADSAVVRVVISAAVAAICGFVGTVGPRTALAGVMALVLVTIYAGTPGDLDAGAISAVWVGAGGAVYVLTILPDWPLRTMQGLRTTIATAYRGIGLGAIRADHAISATGLALLPATANDLVAVGDTRGRTRVWADSLVGSAEMARRGLISLSTEQVPAADDLRHRAGLLMIRIAACLDLPLRHRQVRRAREAMDHAARAALGNGVPPPLVTAVITPVERAAELVLAPWPTRSRAQTGSPAPLVDAPWNRLRQSLTLSDLFARHALRLAVAIAVATVVGELLASEPGYWVPLTVAWISKPDLAGTVGRVVMRLGGTVVGVLVATVAAYVFTTDLAHAAVIGTGAFAVSAFLLANYTAAVTGITTFVIMLLALTGEPVRALAGWRVTDTLIAGVIVLAAALILPHATGSSVHRDLAELARCGAAYSDAVLTREPGAMTRRREAVLVARMRAEAAATAASQEPVRHELSPLVALSIMADLRLVSAQLLRWHELSETRQPPPTLAPRAHDGLLALAQRLDDPGSPGVQWRVPLDATAAELDLLGPIASAHARLSGNGFSPQGTAEPR